MKTLAIRMDDELHAQLSVLAQLSGNSITDEIRQAIETHLEAMRTNPELSARAGGVLDDIERQAQERAAAITTLFSDTAEQPGGKQAKRRSRASGDQPAS